MIVSHRVAGKSIRIPGMHGFVTSTCDMGCHVLPYGMQGLKVYLRLRGSLGDCHAKNRDCLHISVHRNMCCRHHEFKVTTYKLQIKAGWLKCD